MRMMKTTTSMLCSMLIAGCSGTQIRENMYHGMYDGLRVDSARGTSPAENAAKPDVSYDQYMQQRKELLNRE